MKEKLLISFDVENKLKSVGYNFICGVDEAGRGPFAGPVYAAAVILPDDFKPLMLNDSKKISEKNRNILFDHINENALAVSVGVATVDEIEAYNIKNATMLAMKRAVDSLEISPEYILIDGDTVPDGFTAGVTAIIRGDELSYSIAAASVIAKVSRDRFMCELDKVYPLYNFAKHKGYGTAAHREAILLYGACDEHRKSFLKKMLAKAAKEQHN